MLTVGGPVVVLDVGDEVVAHTGHIGSQEPLNRVVVECDDKTRRTIAMSDPRLLLPSEVLELREPEKAAHWYDGYFSRRKTDSIAATLASLVAAMPLGA